MPGDLLPLRPFGAAGVFPSPRSLAIPSKAFPFKLKFASLSSSHRPSSFLLVGGLPGRGGRRMSLPAASSFEKGVILEEHGAELGERESGRGKRDVGRDGTRGRGKRDDWSAPPKKQRSAGSSFLEVLGESKKSRNSNGKEKPSSSIHIGEKQSSSSKEVFEAASFGSGDGDSGGVVFDVKGGLVDGVSESSTSLHGKQAGSNFDAGSNFSGQDESYLSDTRFEQCRISSLSLRGIREAGYERMTQVQAATLPVILEGKDVLAKAKTGTGKTTAFLLPAIELLSVLSSVDHQQKRPPINVLVLCPTRELANQVAAEAKKLLKYHRSFGVQVLIGGTRLTQEQRSLQANPCQIVVATPGRLKDHIENTPGFAARLMCIKVLILDEADRLLDMGFRKDIEKIIASVPKQRQTLLFSATIPEEVHQICHVAMKKKYEFVNTVEEGSEETHSQVRQTYMITSLNKHFSTIYFLLMDHVSEDADYKVIVFCTTAMVTKLVAELLSKLHLNVREIHSRKSQSYRSKVSEEFRQSKGLILVSSDVSARGVDYPDVTLVIQVGMPADREQYIHRLGRTGRKGKEGKGILLLAPWEKFFLDTIKDLPAIEAPLPSIDSRTQGKVDEALLHVEMKSKESAYQAWLGYYKSIKSISSNKPKLVGLAEEFSQSMGLAQPPPIPKLILRKMGLINVPGLRSI